MMYKPPPQAVDKSISELAIWLDGLSSGDRVYHTDYPNFFECAKRLRTQAARIAELEKDAARWKWLRANWFEFGLHNRNTKIGQYLHDVGNAGDIETLDAAIDTAVQEGSKG